MNLKQLCELLTMPEEMTNKVLHLSSSFDEKVITAPLERLYSPETREESYREIQKLLGEDPDGSKMLVLMLTQCLESYKKYQERQIGNEIFCATMKYCTRFVNMHHDVYGAYAFKWGFWFPRQLALQEFRIGAFEYEMLADSDGKRINLHIPGDADMSHEAMASSFAAAKKFFKEQYPEFAEAEVVCDSWLLSPMLKELLPGKSKILHFQQAFDVIKVNEGGKSCLLWVYGRDDLPLDELPQQTSLQKKLKTYIENGGTTSEGYGVLRKSFW